MVKDDRYYLELALEEAEMAFSEETVPIGAVIVGPDGEMISKGRNRVFTSMDPSCHAEIDVIRKAGKQLLHQDYKKGFCWGRILKQCMQTLLLKKL